MAEHQRVLVVDDDPIVADSLSEFLAAEGLDTVTAGDGAEALDLLAQLQGDGDAPGPRQRGVGLVIADLNMPRCDGLELLKAVHKKYPSVAVIIVTGFGKIESAVEAIKHGAVDYLTKPVVDDELRIAVGRALQHHALVAENQTLKHQLVERFGMGNLVGADYRMQKIYDMVEAVAESRTTVLIEGESGTGKSMVARAVHTRSPRRAGPFVTFACGAIPETLLESELFGHVKGAFTGADADKPGKILAAEGGTLFIDEINSATPALQLKLLRVLQEKQFEPVGSTKTVHADVRVVLATNQPLEPLVRSGAFREDLYYRINVVNLKLPPLRERVSDVALLAEHLLKKHCKEAGRTVTGFTEDAIKALQRYDWPGNVRELENVIERAVVLGQRPVIAADDLGEAVLRSSGRAGSAVSSSGAATGAASGVSSGGGGGVVPAIEGGWHPMPLSEAMEAPERAILLAALEANDWNRQETARQLDINRTTLYKKIKHYRLDEPE